MNEVAKKYNLPKDVLRRIEDERRAAFMRERVLPMEKVMMFALGVRAKPRDAQAMLDKLSDEEFQENANVVFILELHHWGYATPPPGWNPAASVNIIDKYLFCKNRFSLFCKEIKRSQRDASYKPDIVLDEAYIGAFCSRIRESLITLEESKRKCRKRRQPRKLSHICFRAEVLQREIDNYLKMFHI